MFCHHTQLKKVVADFMIIHSVIITIHLQIFLKKKEINRDKKTNKNRKMVIVSKNKQQIIKYIYLKQKNTIQLTIRKNKEKNKIRLLQKICKVIV